MHFSLLDVLPGIVETPPMHYAKSPLVADEGTHVHSNKLSHWIGFSLVFIVDTSMHPL